MAPPADVEVFSSAEAVVSDEFLGAISEDKLSFFNYICSVAQVNIICNAKGSFTAQGSWKKIIALEEILMKTLRDFNQQSKEGITSSSANYFINDASAALSLSHSENKDCHEEDVYIRPAVETRSSELDNCSNNALAEGGSSYKESVVVNDDDGNEIYVNITLATCNDVSVEPSAATSIGDNQSVDSVDGSANHLKSVQSEEENQNLSQSSNKAVSEKDKRKIYEQQAPFKYFCNLCSFKTKRESHYKKHIQLHKQGSAKLYVCSQCSFRTIRMGHLRRHELQHASEALSCTKCPYTTDSLFFLQRHHRLKHSSSSKEQTSSAQEQLKCPNCDYKTTQAHFLKRHLRVHQASEDVIKRSLHQCEKCSYTTWRKEHFERHQRDVHSELRPFLCDTCGKAFKRADALRQHRVSRHHPSPTPEPGTTSSNSVSSAHCCPQCSKPCRSRAHLKDHMAAHSDERSFLCEICGSSFKTRAVQRKHIATVHANPKAFPCNHCVRRFSTKYALLRHKKIHGIMKDGSEVPARFSISESRVLNIAEAASKLGKVTTSKGFVSETAEGSGLGSHGEEIPIGSERLGNLEELQVQPGSSFGTDGKDILPSLEGKGNNDPRGCAVVIGMDGEMQSVSGGILTRTPAPSETTTALLYLTTDFTQYR
ncbi:transcriptional repressor CTCFL-like [Ischnura elegans]|uniref:transcriptional repressor CTCFL-like n=1 Tax=Ischnura elegans TaxID=197161 RepID=UPI001ED86D0C|nr:transcriptional repressor CTCFL-like [Ischnura elegans]